MLFDVHLHYTYYCHCVSSEGKMTFAELKTLVETMQNLPCVMSQLEEVQVRSFYLSKGRYETYNFSSVRDKR